MARSTRLRTAATIALAALSTALVLAVGLAWLRHAPIDRLVTHTVGVFVVLAELWRDGILYPPEPTADLVYTTFYHPLAFGPIALLPGRGYDLLPALRILVGVETWLALGLVGWLGFRLGRSGGGRPPGDSSRREDSDSGRCDRDSSGRGYPAGDRPDGDSPDRGCSAGDRPDGDSSGRGNSASGRRDGDRPDGDSPNGRWATEQDPESGAKPRNAAPPDRRSLGNTTSARNRGWALLVAAQPALWLLCTVPVGFGLIGMRDDPRAALLGLLAVAVYLKRRAWTDVASGVVLALAFFVKATAPFAPSLAIAGAAALHRGFGAAARVALSATVVVGAGIAWLQWGLGADFLGNGLYRAIIEPARAPRPWSEALALLLRDSTWDYALPALLIASTIALGRAVLRRRAGLADALVALAWIKTAFAYRSTGTDLNHLLDLALFAALQVGGHLRPWLTTHPARPVAVLAILIALGAPRAIRDTFAGAYEPALRTPIAQSERKLGADFLATMPPARTLCEEPLMAWHAGQKPLVTDPFLTFAALSEPPYDAIRRAWFGPADQPGAIQRILLMKNPNHPDADEWYGRLHFDADFLDLLRTHWRVVGSSGQLTLLTRR